MEKKIIIIFIVILVVLMLSYIYKIKLAGPSDLEVHSSCHAEGVAKAQEEYERENPKKKDEIERGTYFKDDYNRYYNECMIAKEYQ